MEQWMDLCSPQERAAFRLRGLYQTWGYEPYKMSKFEPYDLYAQNRSFLVGNQILSFTDLSGKLMALKPDVTLSIIKNYIGGQRKVYYHENIYRDSGSGEFQEIAQVGLEAIGTIDDYTQLEVLTLASESLSCLDEHYLLDVASVGVISGLITATDAPESICQALLKAVQGKNTHSVTQLCRQQDLPEMVGRAWETLAKLYGSLEETLPQLRPLCLNREMTAACHELEGLLQSGLRLNLDFSIVSDLKYYNGLVFKGYVPGIHTGVLSGGRYDHLVHQMGKNAGAIGFAVYLDQLDQLPDCTNAQTLLCYGTQVSAGAVLAQAAALRQTGRTFRVRQDSTLAPTELQLREGDGT